MSPSEFESYMQTLTPAHVPAGLGARQAQGLQESDQSFRFLFWGFALYLKIGRLLFLFFRSDINFFDILRSDFMFYLSGVIFPFF